MLSKLLALMKSHGTLSFQLGMIVFKNPALAPDIVAMEEGAMTFKDFALAHQDVVAEIIDLVNASIKSDPTLLPAILGAF